MKYNTFKDVYAEEWKNDTELTDQVYKYYVCNWRLQYEDDHINVRDHRITSVKVP